MVQKGTRAGGMAVAVVLHAAVILLLYLHRPEHRAEPAKETWIQLVKVQPPKPRPALPPVAVAPQPRPKHVAARPAPARETAILPIAPIPVEAPLPVADKPASIDMDAARRVAAQVAREENQRARTHPNLLKTERPTKQERLARAIENARKPDCKTAYAGAGIFALIPLAKNALSSDPSCRW